MATKNEKQAKFMEMVERMGPLPVSGFASTKAQATKGYMKKIWMRVGDDYDLMAFSEDTPCTQCHGGREQHFPSDVILPLSQAMKCDWAKIDVLIWSGGWRIASFDEKNYLDIELQFTLKNTKIDKEDFAERLWKVLQDNKEKFPELSWISPRVK